MNGGKGAVFGKQMIIVAEVFANVMFSILPDYMQTFAKAYGLTYIGIPQAKLQFKTNSRASAFQTCAAHEEARSTSGIQAV